MLSKVTEGFSFGFLLELVRFFFQLDLGMGYVARESQGHLRRYMQESARIAVDEIYIS